MPEAEQEDKDLIARAEASIAAGPEPQDSSGDVDLIKKLDDIMRAPGVSRLCGMLVLNWRMYAVIRQELETLVGRKLEPSEFSALLQGVAATAMEPFSIVHLRREVKKSLLPWLSSVTAGRTQVRRKDNENDAEHPKDDSGAVSEAAGER